MTNIFSKDFRRLNSIDFLRGLVMVIMLLDHVRDFLHSEAYKFQPTDLTKTSAAIFFTRWVTHICAPTFVFLAGTSIYLQMIRGKSLTELSKFLLTRGLWLIVLEFTVIRFSLFFNLDYSFFGLAEVIWIFGVSMIVLAGLIHLPVRAVGIIGIAIILLHPLLDFLRVPPNVSFAGNPPPDLLQKLLMILHQPGFIPLADGVKMFVAYPLLPWVGVMAAGYWFGVVYTWDAEKRRRLLLRLGVFCIVLFAVLSAVSLCFDGLIWSGQAPAFYTFLAFFNATKYPPSLIFLLMTLGPSLIILSASDVVENKGFVNRFFITFGRVPLFYFILQMFYSHSVTVLLGYLAGKDNGYLFKNFPDSAAAPPDAGFSLWIVYAAWFAGLIVLYPLCAWYGKMKQGRSGFPFSYL